MENQPWCILVSKISNFEFKPGVTTFINPFSMLMLQKQYSVAKGIDNLHIDGISLVKLFNRNFKAKIKRYSFDETSVAPRVFKFAKENNLSVAIIGTEEHLIGKAVANIQLKHSIKVTFFRNGYFESRKAFSECYRELVKRKIDVVICGMGTPFQEEFLIGLKEYGWSGYGYTCGGYLHQIAEKPNYYPKIFDDFNIRWLYRIIEEPRTLKRYLLKYPLFYFKFKYFAFLFRA